MVTEWKLNRLGRHTTRVQTKPAKAVALRVMSDIVDMSKWPERNGIKFGIEGLEAFAADIADTSKDASFASLEDMT